MFQSLAMSTNISPNHHAVEIVEVGPRDGLQNEQAIVSTADKVRLIEKSIDAGSRRIEVASFVNPRRVPQMADADEVCAALPGRDDVTYIGLVMNLRGAERAAETGRNLQLGAVAVSTDQFAMANQGQTSDGSVESAKAIITYAQSRGLSAQCTIGASFGCPFEGEVEQDRVVAMAKSIAAAGPVEIALADTIGVANPAHVEQLVKRVRDAIDPLPVRVHFHNTRGTGLANVWAAVRAGAQTVDTALGGLGGCPFAKGSAGNVSSEDVIYMLERAGISTGMNLDALIAANSWLSGVMNKKLPGLVAIAPAFPQQA
ncbi:(R)-citramalyl-CoA lyase [Sphingorhabdus sp. 109]|jgi:hydroxymethylglutaryl-CoA lyase|nr:(R)-citramalyl-CoA lyase [Sphingorhabdus sp. 109]